MNRILYLLISVLLFAISYVTLSFFSQIQGITKVPFFGSYFDGAVSGIRIVGLVFGLLGVISLIFALTKHFAARVIFSLIAVFITMLVIMGLPLFDQIWGYLKSIPVPSVGFSAIFQQLASNAQNYLSNLQ